MIIGVGPDSADIMLVGDYGTKEDGVKGEALSGSQVAALDGLWRDCNFSSRATYRTLLIKDTLEYDGRAKKLKFLAIQKAHVDGALKGHNYESILKQEISEVRPNIIMPLGDMALKFLSGYSSLNNYRGSVLPLAPSLQALIPNKHTRVIGSFSPRMLRENPVSRIYVALDYQKAFRLRDRTDPIEKEGAIWVCRTINAFRNFLARQQDIMDRPVKDRFMVFDVETYCGFITAISFCFDGKESCSIPMTLVEGMDYANSFLLQVEIAKILASRIPKVNQNIKYDWVICERFGFRVENVVGDTALALKCLYPELNKNLGFQTSIWTDLPYFKDESDKKQVAFNPKLYTKDSLYLYNAKDSLATWQIYRKQLDEMEEARVDHVYHKEIVPLIKVYKNIDSRGLLVDQERRRELRAKYQSLRDITITQFMARIEPLAKFESLEQAKKVLNSPTQIGAVIYDVLKYPVRYKMTDGGKRTYKTDKDTLDDLMILHGDQNKLGHVGAKILRYIITVRKLTKVIEYIDTALHPDGTLKTSYDLGGTKTGRSSATKTSDQLLVMDEKGKLIWPMKRLGRSLQTITKHGFDTGTGDEEGEVFEGVGDERLGEDLRSMFIPRKGFVFAEGDGSQAEARVVAVLAEDYELLKQFDIKPKIHARTAGMIFKIDPTTITSSWPVIPDIGITYYDLGKRIRHAGNYNMGGFRLSQMTHIAVDQCDSMIVEFHGIAPKIRGIFHKDVWDALTKTGELRTPLGRLRQFFSKLDSHTAKEAYAHIPQSTISDQTKFAIPRIERRAPYAKFVYEGHDASMAEIPEDRIEHFGAIFTEEMELPINFRGCTLARDIDLTIPCEFMIGVKNWKEMEVVKVNR